VKLEAFAWRWHWREAKYMKKSFARTRKGRVKRICAQFGEQELADITWPQVRDWIRSLEIGHTGPRELLSAFRCLLAAAEEDGLIERNPLVGRAFRISRVDLDKEIPEPFNAEEREALLWHCDGPIRNLLQTMMWTGMRPSEVRALQWENIDFAKGEIRIVGGLSHDAKEIEQPKTRASRRTIKMLGPARSALLDQTQFTEGRKFVFVNPRTDERWKLDTQFSDIMKAVCAKAGVKYRHPYMLRHTYASMLLTAGEDIAWISHQLGHRNPVITGQIYAKWMPTDNPTAGSKAEQLYSCL
jgi:integrase